MSAADCKQSGEYESVCNLRTASETAPLLGLREEPQVFLPRRSPVGRHRGSIGSLRAASPCETASSLCDEAPRSKFLAPDPVPQHSRMHGLARALEREQRTPGGESARSSTVAAARGGRRDTLLGSITSPLTSFRRTSTPTRRRRWSWSYPSKVSPLPLLVDHTYNVERRSIALRSRFKDSYHNLIDLSWWKLLVLMLTVWISLLLVFSVILKIGCSFPDVFGPTVVSTEHGPDEDVCTFHAVFFFSVHTLSTTGYGALFPSGYFGQLVAMMEMWVSIVFSSVGAALAFHKLARPSKLRESIIFSDSVCINSETLYWKYAHREIARKDPCAFCVERGAYDSGERCLTFRIAHTHQRQHTSPSVRLFLYQEFPGHPEDARDTDQSHLVPINYSFTELNFYCTLQYGRARGISFSTPMPCLPLLVTHHLDEHSPLRGATREDLVASRAEIVAVYDAVDEGCGDSVQCRHAWRADEVLWDHRFVDMVFRDSSTGKIVVDFHLLNRTVECPPHQEDRDTDPAHHGSACPPSVDSTPIQSGFPGTGLSDSGVLSRPEGSRVKDLAADSLRLPPARIDEDARPC
eukprot:TRINITY_DN7802_c0_g2_i1.p1 TRINITY_DN7802_c0_g2~~TRINITY_DN7802_c0_g2_i1.p1  ORF type:complete len:662 (+),score=159.00 TRINITY_DN7802_c0_g2_i1:253-1986(+)